MVQFELCMRDTLLEKTVLSSSALTMLLLLHVPNIHAATLLRENERGDEEHPPTPKGAQLSHITPAPASCKSAHKPLFGHDRFRQKPHKAKTSVCPVPSRWFLKPAESLEQARSSSSCNIEGIDSRCHTNLYKRTARLGRTSPPQGQSELPQSI
eukprot:1613572-Amphidinium_carterae.1